MPVCINHSLKGSPLYTGVFHNHSILVHTHLLTRPSAETTKKASFRNDVSTCPCCHKTDPTNSFAIKLSQLLVLPVWWKLTQQPKGKKNSMSGYQFSEQSTPLNKNPFYLLSGCEEEYTGTRSCCSKTNGAWLCCEAAAYYRAQENRSFKDHK